MGTEQKHILIDPDTGRLSVSEELARAVIDHMAHVCQYHGATGPTVVPLLLGMCAGFSLGAYAPGRDLIPPMHELINDAVTHGVRDGMALNAHFPKLDS